MKKLLNLPLCLLILLVVMNFCSVVYAQDTQIFYAKDFAFGSDDPAKAPRLAGSGEAAYLGNLHNLGSWFSVTGVDGGATGGKYIVQLKYAIIGTPSWSIYVNGVSQMLGPQLPSTGDNYGYVVADYVIVTLNPGKNNTVKFLKGNASANVNYIAFKPLLKSLDLYDATTTKVTNVNNVPTNATKAVVEFNTLMTANAVTSENIKLYRGKYKIPVEYTGTYNATTNQYELVFTPPFKNDMEYMIDFTDKVQASIYNATTNPFAYVTSNFVFTTEQGNFSIDKSNITKPTQIVGATSLECSVNATNKGLQEVKLALVLAVYDENGTMKAQGVTTTTVVAGAINQPIAVNLTTTAISATDKVKLFMWKTDIENAELGATPVIRSIDLQ